MILAVLNHSFHYETENLCRLFFPNETIKLVYENGNYGNEDTVETRIADGTVYVFCLISGKSVKKQSPSTFSEKDELVMGRLLFDCLSEITGYLPPWGVLTGVRPSKLMTKYIRDFGETQAIKRFKENLLVSDAKTALAAAVSKAESEIISLSQPDSFSLYVSIPFCPTRCSYCSFVSNSIDKAIRIIPSYIEYLCKEIEFVSKIVKEKKLRLETVYIGGGTPTTLSPEDLETVLGKIRSSFDLSTCREFTVEAGRPDTITKDKLVALKKFGVSRISINPQTLNDNVLSVIGRRHTSKQFFESFKLARDVGFDNINTDLIAGLPSDTYDSFCKTIDEIIKISPENVTVHSLSMKRASTLTAVGFSPEIDAGVLSTKMVEYARTSLTKAKIFPYYMYRQSKTVGNLENVGYSKKGFEGLYNVFIMDETHSIIACGASAATKLRNPIDGKIERIFNFKYPFEYLSRFDEQIERKKGIYEFYSFL